ncbi:hypothetical protein FACS1894105_10210 [Clostridia bacterium]|nr:hypothetical protein FACS1894105_10210 [Clostridia bacterium]
MFIFVRAASLETAAEWTTYGYLAYLIAFSVVCVLIAAKLAKDHKDAALWFVGIVFIMIFKAVFYVKIIATAFTEIDSFSLWGSNLDIPDSVYYLWDALPTFDLYAAGAVVFMIYAALWLITSNKAYIIFAAINLAVFAAVTAFIPSAEYLAALPEADGAGWIIVMTIIKESGLLLYLLNLTVVACVKSGHEAP